MINLRSRFSHARTQMPLKPLISSRARIFWEDGPPRTLYALLVGGGGAIKKSGRPEACIRGDSDIGPLGLEYGD